MRILRVRARSSVGLSLALVLTLIGGLLKDWRVGPPLFTAWCTQKALLSLVKFLIYSVNAFLVPRLLGWLHPRKLWCMLMHVVPARHRFSSDGWGLYTYSGP